MNSFAKSIVGAIAPRLLDYARVYNISRKSLGYWPNLVKPKTFNEKVQYRKLFDRDPRLPQRADKILAKQFVSAKVGSDWITPTLWHGSELPDAPDRTWPLPFVIKASHGSAMNRFVRRVDERNWPDIEKCCEDWLQRDYSTGGVEWLYSQIAPRLLVEPFIGALAVLPLDYKLWTFGGRVEFIQVDTDREANHKRVMFDRDWNRLPFTSHYPTDERAIVRPVCLTQMIEAAEILSEDISFVRVDFYEIDRKPLFGEMTFYPDSGWGKFSPETYDLTIGRLWAS